MKQRRQFSHKHSPMRATVLCSAVMFMAIMISLSFSEASTLPFGRIDTSRKQTNLGPSTVATGSKLSNNIRSQLLKTRAGSSVSFVGPPPANLALESLSYYLRVALAGGVAGATGSAVLYPIDSAKTLRQSDPGSYSSVKDALFKMLRSKHSIQRVYNGILPAALGAIPSSALYFGAYESSKVTLQKFVGDPKDNEKDYRKRLFVHGLAAASGNVISSFVFVPKEVIKQQLQIRYTDGAARTTVRSIVRQKGITGLYAGYGATLLRNIPSAIMRFVLYEELKRKWATAKSFEEIDNHHHSFLPGRAKKKLKIAGTFLAGAVAGSTSSFVMTPIDVVKTRMATGSCPLGVKNCMVHVIQEVGWKGLYAGAGSRVLWSGAFSAIGFGTFELVKGYLGVATESKITVENTKGSSAPRMATIMPKLPLR